MHTYLNRHTVLSQICKNVLLLLLLLLILSKLLTSKKCVQDIAWTWPWVMAMVKTALPMLVQDSLACFLTALGAILL